MISLLSLALLPAAASAASLKLATKHQGTTFFDGWNVNGSATDPTQYGSIHYLNQSAAQSSKLLSVNGAGHAILKVDNTTSDPNPGPYSQFGRDTVMVISQETIDVGTLVVMDALHIPYGCSVWPAFWTLDAVGHNDSGGEIDIVEAVNLMQNNQFSLHANPGCTLANSSYTGTEVFANCDFTFSTTGNQGCGIQEKASSKSLGAAFAQNGGGVYAMYWTTAGIQLWFFERNNIPSDLAGEGPDPTGWGTPSASYPASGCDPAKFFNPQSMIINIDVCGAWAGNGAVYTSTGCTGQCTDMVGTASNYDNAYWEIAYVKTFNAAGNATVSASGSATGTSHSAGATGTGASGGSNGAAAQAWSGAAFFAAALAFLA